MKKQVFTQRNDRLEQLAEMSLYLSNVLQVDD